MMHHGALAQIGALRIDCGSNSDHYATWLMPGHNWRRIAIAERPDRLTARGTIKLKVASTHA
jgi:hypothetical protein